MKYIILIIILLFPSLTYSINFKWSGKGHLYDQRNQYTVMCRLVKEKRVEPWLGEDSVKCHYRCQDEFVITTHSDFACQKQVTQTRGDKRDWRSK